MQPPHIPLGEGGREEIKKNGVSLCLNGGGKLGEPELGLAALQLLAKLILWLKGLFSFLLALHSAQPVSVAPQLLLKYNQNNYYKMKSLKDLQQPGGVQSYRYTVRMSLSAL